MPRESSAVEQSLAESSKRAAKKRISDEEWAVNRGNISRLYLDEGKDVREVRDIMKREFGFEAQ
jgi:Clr5 domain